jgi:hypothetical protein
MDPHEEHNGLLKHNVYIKFKDELSTEVQNDIIAQFLDLPKQFPHIAASSIWEVTI